MSSLFVSWLQAARPWLELGRVSNLPTVWSNCLAAWLRGGGGSWGRFLAVCVGTSCVYVGGMFLNDACDERFDRRARSERPIPRGAVESRTVWRASAGVLGAGWLLLAMLGPTTAMLGGLLVVSVVVYDFTHKFVSFSPVTMALCRHLLYLVAGSAAWNGVVGDTVWSGLALGAYVIGLSYIARGESVGGVPRWWSLPLLLAPLGLAVFMNPFDAWGRSRMLMPVLILLIWTAKSLAELYRPGGGGAKTAVSGLLAGIVFVDVLATVPAPWPWGAAFLGFFGLALLLQRRVAAT